MPSRNVRSNSSDLAKSSTTPARHWPVSNEGPTINSSMSSARSGSAGKRHAQDPETATPVPRRPNTHHSPGRFLAFEQRVPRRPAGLFFFKVGAAARNLGLKLLDPLGQLLDRVKIKVLARHLNQSLPTQFSRRRRRFIQHQRALPAC